MMLWANFNYAYNQNSMGYSGGSDVSWMFYGNRGWTKPRAVGYMESHDEERLMYKNINYGNINGTYSVKDIATGLERMKAASAFFIPIPGPKMIWEFGELGYDFSINTCSDGTINNNCRVSAKPVKWEYRTEPNRTKLNKVVSALTRLKTIYPVFQTSDFALQGGTSLAKQIILKGQPYTSSPSTTDNMNLVVVGNFDVTSQAINVNFPHVGNWFHYFAQGDPLTVAATPQSITLQPGEFRIYTDVQLPALEQELIAFSKPIAPVLTTLTQIVNKVQLTWSDNSTIETGYSIYRKKSGGAYVKVGEVAANVTTYLDGQNLESATSYEYYVEANNPYTSSPSNNVLFTTGIITAIAESANVNLVYPNPTSGIIYIDESVVINKLVVRTLQGAEVHPVSIDSHRYDFTHFSSGIYILEVCSNSSVVRFKLIKN
jgi:hypothetical protein